MRTRLLLCSIVTLASLTVPAASTSAPDAPDEWLSWSPAEPVIEVNSAAADGCPIESQDGLSLYIASTRFGGGTGNDIWAADRSRIDLPFGAPVKLEAPVNTDANDFCPTPIHGSLLLFVSERSGPDTCAAGPGRGDIYMIRRNAALGWGAPQHLGCAENGTGPNTAGAEFSPSLVTTRDGTYLYFSSTVTGNHDIYRSRLGENGRFGPPVPVDELNGPFDDRMPNVRSDGLEVVFSSTRPSDAHGTAGFGSFDVYVSRRASPNAPWSAPVNLGPNVNSAGSETRASISWDGRRLYFGRDGEIFSSSRAQPPGSR